ncbi:MAG: M20/M25/M40 family metallo-hydrolase [bacterium]|nr:M20/M25/M40 family metallo-hydrolase [bacterium]
MINNHRLKQMFFDLIQIDSHSREEKDVAQYILMHLKKIGAEVEIDDAGNKIGGNCSNILARFSGPLRGKVEPLVFCAHMDTVVPGKGVKPVEVDGVIRSSGDTILGSDDKSGIAAILEMLYILKEKDIPYGELEILFTVAEEVGLLGAREFDTRVLKSKRAYFLDTEAVDSICVGAPAAYRMTYKVIGKEAHAGLSPERGLSAILVTSRAITQMPLGRIDHETTANIGVIEGGTATNIVAREVTLRGEARSHDDAKLEKQVEAMRAAFDKAAADSILNINGQKIQAEIEEKRTLEYKSFRISESSPTYQLAYKAGKKLGMEMMPEVSGGGSDANIFNGKGIESVILGTGMQEVHTINEYIKVSDLENCAKLILNLAGEI